MKDLLQLGWNDCRWPEGDRAPYRFCGMPKAPRSSYCGEHTALSAGKTIRTANPFTLPPLQSGVAARAAAT